MAAEHQNGRQTRQPQRLLMILAYVGFISLGLPDGLLGVGWPSIRAFFGLPLNALGALLVAFTCGYLVSSATSGRVLARLGVGGLLTLSGAATALSLLGYANTPVWLGMVGLGVVAGLGAGAIDAGLNTYAATHFSARTMNWLHACFGLGAATGPLVMTAVLSNELRWQVGYLLVGGAQIILTVCFALTRRRWDAADAAPSAEAAPAVPERPEPSLATLRLPTVWISIAIFLLYTGLEITAGQWAYSVLTLSRAVPATQAGLWVSVYWAGLTAGRLLFGVIVGMAPLNTLLRGALALAVLGALLFALNLAPLVSGLGLALLGFALAPIFPSLMSLTPERLGAAHAANSVGFQVAAAALGGALLPSLAGQLGALLGLESIGFYLAGAAVLLLALHELLLRRPHSAPRQAPALGIEN